MASAIPTLTDSAIVRLSRAPGKPKPISLHRAMDKFFDRDDAEFLSGTRAEYDNALLALTIYIDSFAGAMLDASGIMPTLTTPKNGPASKRYTPSELVRFFPSFVRFFLVYKVNAPEKVKDVVINIFKEFIKWLLKKGHLQDDVKIELTDFSFQNCFEALHALTLLKNTVAHTERLRKNMEDIRNGEPLYMVSRVKSGRMWFLHFIGTGYEEFGPVSVSLGVSDIVKPGWFIECEFGKFDGRWCITSVEGILPP